MGRYDRFTKAFSSGLKDTFAPFDEAGPDITVSPFAPGEASTGAGILRAITAVAGARRARANWELDQQSKAASRYRDALETKMLEARLAGTDPASVTAAENAASLKAYREGILDLRRNPPKKPGGTAKPNAALILGGLKDFDARGEAFADEALRTPRVAPGGKKLPPIIDVGQSLARLLKTAKTPSEQLKYAQALGVSPMKEVVDETDADGKPTGKSVARFVLDKDSRYQFDQKAINDALQSWIATRRAGVLNQWRSQNAGKRSMYEKALMNTAFGDVGEEPADPLEEAALELFGSQ